VPLVVSGQVDGRKIIVFAFDLHDTDLPLRKDFPIFMYELCNRFMPSEALAAQTLTTGTIIEIQPEPNASGMDVVLLDGARVKLAPPFPAAPLMQTAQAGVYTLEQRIDETVRRTPFAVNIAATAESDLRRVESQGYQSESAGLERAAGRMDLTVFVLLGLLACLMVEWWVYSKR